MKAGFLICVVFGLTLLSSESKWMNIMKYMRFIILFI